VPGVVRYEIPPEHRAALNAAVLRVTFDPALTEKYDGVELLTPGSLLLDKIIEDASSRGHHCVARVKSGEGSSEKEVLVANLSFRNATPEVSSSERDLVPYMLFTFRATMITDEKTELLETVLLNSESLREHRVSDLFFEEALALPEEPLAGKQDIQSLYVAGCERIENKIGRAVADCRESARGRLAEEEQRIEDYFAGLTREVQESKYPEQAKAAIEAYAAEESKRLEEARLKYSLDAKLKLVGVRTIMVPTVKMAVRLTGRNKGGEIELQYDEVSLEIPPPKCVACGTEMTELGLCDEGHVICAKCEQMCAICDRVSCQACEEIFRVSQKCAQCGRLLCEVHAMRDDFGLGIYCPEHIVDCPFCGKKASGSFVARCERCNQRYCFLCVAAKEKSCGTCRSLTTVAGDDADVSRVKSQSAFSGKFGKWKVAKNRRFTIIEGRSMLARRMFVMDKEGKLVWEG
jgi:hypothetical protein